MLIILSYLEFIEESGDFFRIALNKQKVNFFSECSKATQASFSQGKDVEYKEGFTNGQKVGNDNGYTE